ncbi:SH3 domain-containing protein [Peribacillus frigoritolerans]|nr:SH3 domain-containing protein [Peribacillus frigoritolerans]
MAGQKIKAYGGEGYVSTKYLSATKPGSVPGLNPDGEANTLVKYVNVSDGSSLNMRSAASASASIIAKLVNNTAVTVYSESNGWSRVTANGKNRICQYAIFNGQSTGKVREVRMNR